MEKQDVVKNRELEPSEDFARRGDIDTERRDHEGPFPDHGGGDEESGRPVQLGGRATPEAGADDGDPPEGRGTTGSELAGVQE